MEDTGHAKRAWFEEILELPNGIAASDTFRRVFERLDSEELSSVLSEIVDVKGKLLR